MPDHQTVLLNICCSDHRVGLFQIKSGKTLRLRRAGVPHCFLIGTMEHGEISGECSSNRFDGWESNLAGEITAV
jgi:hypothetical protein